MDRDATIVEERRRGSTLRAIAERHDISHERVRQIVAEHIVGITMQIWACQKQGSLYALAIPPGTDAKQSLALDYAHWVLGELRKGEMTIACHYRPAGVEGAFILALEDVGFTRMLAEAGGE